MRVGIVAGPHYTIPPQKYGGTEVIIYNLIKGLKELGHEPILFGPADSVVDCEIVPVVDKAIGYPVEPKELDRHFVELKAIQSKTEKLLRQNLKRLDIIHSQGVDLIKLQDFPNLTTIHAAVSFDDLDYYERRKNLYFASVSENQQDSFPDLQYVGIVYNGEEPDNFKLVEKPEDYLCFLGRIDDEKNPHLAIKLAINLGIKIKLAGKLDYHGANYFKEKVEPHLNDPLVEYLGELGFKDKIKLLANAKCNLHPAGFREPFGLTVLEAAYCGTPTLATEQGSMPELIENGRTGLLVEDFIEGFHQIEQCFDMDRAYISSRAKSLFNYQIMSKQYIKAYERVIDIFKTRAEQDELIRTMTNESSHKLKEIWRQTNFSNNKDN